MRVALRELALPIARAASDLRVEGGRADALVDVEDASHARICTDRTFTEDCCDAAPGRVEVPEGARRGCEGTVRLEALAGPTVTDGDFGTIRVWSRATTPLADFVSVPEERADGRFETRACLSATTDDIGVASDLFDRVVFDPLDLTRFTLTNESGSFTLDLGATEDTLRFTDFSGFTYAATLAHAPTDRTLAIGSFESAPLEVDLADVVVTNVDDASDTISVSLHIEGDLPAIARP